jgi:hypothetical protein
VTAAAVLGALLVASPHGWTLTHARQVLGSRTYEVTDTTQADQPRYELRFSNRAARSLRRGFVFDGPAHGLLTDTEVQVYRYILSGLKTPLETGEPLEA